jgi:hypothetical protein
MNSKVRVHWTVAASLAVFAGVAAAPSIAAPAVALQDSKPDPKTEPKQDSKDPKAQLEEKEKAIDAKDAKGFYELAKWADENGLKTDSKRLARKVIKIDPEHVEARAMLGYQKYDGKWLTSREVEREKAKKEDADKEKLGLKKWKNEYVPKEDYEKYEKGLVPVTVDNQKKWVTPLEKERIDKGMSLYEGQWITAEEKEHLAKNEFKVGDKWVSEEEANTAHSDFTKPWELEGDLCTLTTTCKRKFAKEAVKQADRTIREVYNLVGVALPKEPIKIALTMVKDLNDYNTLGNAQGLDANEALMSSNWNTFNLPDPQTGRSIGVTIYWVLDEKNEKGNDDYSLGNVRHAAASACLKNMTWGEAPPPWFAIGVATYLDRFWHPVYQTASDFKKLGGWSARMLEQEGGMMPLKEYFEPFTVNKRSILESGLIVTYLVRGKPGPKVEEQWKKCLEAFKAEKQKGLEKAFVKLEILLQKDGEKEIDAFREALSG